MMTEDVETIQKGVKQFLIQRILFFLQGHGKFVVNDRRTVSQQ